MCNVREQTASYGGWRAECGVQRPACGLELCHLLAVWPHGQTGMLILVPSASQDCCENQMRQCVWKELSKLQCPTNVSYYGSALLFLESLFHFICHMYSPSCPLLPSPQSDQKCLPFSSERGTSLIWQKEMKSPGLLCPVLHLGHGRSTLPARLSSLALIPRTEGKLEQSSHYAGLPTSRGEKCKGAGQRLKCERGSCLWSVREWEET